MSPHEKRCITFEIPLPPADLTANSNKHWRKKGPATKTYRHDVSVLALQAKPKGHVPYPFRIKHLWYMGLSLMELHNKQYAKKTGIKGLKPIHYRPRDIQNAIASLKAAVDGFVDAGLVPDDSAKWVQWGDCTLLKSYEEHLGRSCVVVALEEI